MDRLILDQNLETPESQKSNGSFRKNSGTNGVTNTSIDLEDLSDSGIEKACDDVSSVKTDIVNSSPKQPPDKSNGKLGSFKNGKRRFESIQAKFLIF